MSYETVLYSIVDRFYIDKSKTSSKLNQYDCLNDLIYFRYVYGYDYEDQEVTDEKTGETKTESVCVRKYKVHPNDKTTYKDEEITYLNYYKKMYPDGEFGTENGYLVKYEADYSYVYSSSSLYKKGYNKTSENEEYINEQEFNSTDYFPSSSSSDSESSATTKSVYSKKLKNTNGLLELYQKTYSSTAFSVDSNNNIIVSHPNLKKFFNKTIPEELVGEDSARSAIYKSMKQLYTDLEADYPVEGMNYNLLNSYSNMSQSYQIYDESIPDFVDYYDIWYARGNLYEMVPNVTDGGFINRLLIIDQPELYNNCVDYIDYIANYYLAPYEEEYKTFSVAYTISNNYTNYSAFRSKLRNYDGDAYNYSDTFIEEVTVTEKEDDPSSESGETTTTYTYYVTKLSVKMVGWVNEILKKYPSLTSEMKDYNDNKTKAKNSTYDSKSKIKKSSTETYEDDDEESMGNGANMFWRQMSGGITYAQKVKDYITQAILVDLFQIKPRFTTLYKYIVLDGNLPSYYNSLLSLVTGYMNNDTKTSSSDENCLYDTIHATYTSGSLAIWSPEQNRAYAIYNKSKNKQAEYNSLKSDSESDVDLSNAIYKFCNYYTLCEKLVPNTIDGKTQSYYEAGTSIYNYILWLRNFYGI